MASKFKSNKTIKKEVKSEVKKALTKTVEEKFHNFAIGSAQIAGTGNIWDVTQIAQGLLDSNRVGDHIRPVEVDLFATLRTSINNIDNNIRLILFQWKNQYDSVTGLPTFGDILNSSYSATVNTVNSPYNMDKLGLRRILFDRTYALNLYSKDQHVIRKTRVPMRSIDYQNGSAQYGNGKIFLMAVSDDTTAVGGNMPLLSFVVQVRYTDA